MMNKFKEDGLTWYIDEEKGVFICKCEDAEKQLKKEYYSLTEKYGGDDFWGCDTFAFAEKRWFYNYGKQMNRLFGKAKANTDAGEVIDVERGKALAKSRLVEKLAAYRASFYNAILDDAEKFEKDLRKRINGNVRIGVNAAERITELSGISEEN